MRRYLKKMTPKERDVSTLLSASASAGRGFGVRRGVVWIIAAIGGAVLMIVLLLAGWTAQRLASGKSLTAADDRPVHRDSGLVGEPVRDGQFEFVVREVTCGQPEIPYDFSVLKATGQFCTAPVLLRNIRNQPRLVFANMLRARLSDGEKVGADEHAMHSVNSDDDPMRWIGPGTEVSFTLVFDIRADQQLTGLELHDSPFSRGALVYL